MIAALRHRVAVQENTVAIDGIGEAVNSWATIETVYARVKPLSARDRIIAGAGATVTHVVTMRYRDDLGSNDVELDARYRLTYDSREFSIIGVIDVDERHRFLDVLCAEISPKSPT